MSGVRGPDFSGKPFFPNPKLSEVDSSKAFHVFQKRVPCFGDSFGRPKSLSVQTLYGEFSKVHAFNEQEEYWQMLQDILSQLHALSSRNAKSWVFITTP